MEARVVGRAEAGQKLLRYLRKVLPEAPDSFFYKMLRKKNIDLLGRGKCTGAEVLSEGDTVRFFLSEETFSKFGGKPTEKPSEEILRHCDSQYDSDKDIVSREKNPAQFQSEEKILRHCAPQNDSDTGIVSREKNPARFQSAEEILRHCALQNDSDTGIMSSEKNATRFESEEEILRHFAPQNDSDKGIVSREKNPVRFQSEEEILRQCVLQNETDTAMMSVEKEPGSKTSVILSGAKEPGSKSSGILSGAKASGSKTSVILSGAKNLAYGRLALSGVSVIYEDEDFLFVAKPAGLLVQGDRSGEPSLAGLLRECSSPDSLTKWSPMHRLDRNTSGLVLCGKTVRGQQFLAKALRERTLKKEYLALAYGHLPGEGSFSAYHRKDARTNTVRLYDHRVPGAEPIETIFHEIARKGGYSLIRAELVTGRSHQIRAHLAYLGCPIVGDSKYGSKASAFAGVKAQILHAERVTFENNAEKLAGRTFAAPIPASMKGVLNQIGFQQ